MVFPPQWREHVFGHKCICRAFFFKLDSDYSLIYEYIIDDIYCRGEGMGREGVRSNIIRFLDFVSWFF